MKFLLILLFSLPFFSFSQVEFVWVDSIDDDFSFSEVWDYPEGVYPNEWGQLSCEGLCPPEIERMKDANGRIYDDSLEAFYAIIDTTHIYRSHLAEVRAYEYGEVHQASCTIEENMIVVETAVNAGNHSSLHIEFDENQEPKLKSRVYIVLNSIVYNIGTVYFDATEGVIQISKKAYAKGIIEMRFDLKFENDSFETKGPLTWKGLIRVGIGG